MDKTTDKKRLEQEKKEYLRIRREREKVVKDKKIIRK